MIGLRGFGAIDVGPLAQAQFSGGLNPSFLPTQYFQPSYLPAGQESPLPDWLYADSGFASQIASLLGGSVTQAPPPGGYNGTGIPNANWVSVDGQMILPGNLFQPGTVLAFPDECGAEKYLAASIPGSQMSSACSSGGTGQTPTQLAVSQGATVPVLPSGQSTIVAYTPPAPVVSTPAPPVSIPTPVLPVSAPVSVTAPVLSPTTDAPKQAPPSYASFTAPAQSNGSQMIAAPSSDTSQQSNTTATSGCFNPLSHGYRWIAAWGLWASWSGR